jgi:hypothetical protein
MTNSVSLNSGDTSLISTRNLFFSFLIYRIELQTAKFLSDFMATRRTGSSNLGLHSWLVVLDASEVLGSSSCTWLISSLVSLSK